MLIELTIEDPPDFERLIPTLADLSSEITDTDQASYRSGMRGRQHCTYLGSPFSSVQRS